MQGYNGVVDGGARGGRGAVSARMATPMREGASAGGARPAPHTHPANFEYDDNEWDIGIGDLIIDLDADIEKTDEAGGMAARAEPDAQRTALKMKIKRTKPGTKSSEAKHEIVKSNETNGEPKPPPAPVTAPAAAPAPPSAAMAAKRGSGGHRRDKARDKHHHPHPPHEVNGVTRTPTAPNTPGPPAATALPGVTPALANPPTPAKPEARTVVPSPISRLGGDAPKPPPPTPLPSAPAPPPAPAPALPPPVTPAPPPPPPAPTAKPEPDDSGQDSSQPPAKKIKIEPKVSLTTALTTFLLFSYRGVSTNMDLFCWSK